MRCADGKTLWAMGLDGQALAVLKQCAEPEHTVKAHFPEVFIAEETHAEESPFAICLSMGAWRDLRRRYGEAPCAKPPAWILIVEDSFAASELEDAMSQGFAAILKCPLERNRVLNALSCALEDWHIHQDIMAMGKEIMLNRELLQRKNDSARFLVDFLAQTSEAPRIKDMLRIAARCLATVMPVAGIGALMRHADNAETPRRFLFLPALPDTAAWKEWQMILSCADAKLIALPFLADPAHRAAAFKPETAARPETAMPGVARSFSILEPGEPSLRPSSDKKRMLFTPVHLYGRTSGLLCVQFTREYNIGHERLAILNAALTHLGMGLRTLFLERRAVENADAPPKASPEKRAEA